MELTEARGRIRGALLAGAVGDALGAPVEFMRLAEIRARFGPEGVTGYAPAYGRPGAITDDTQMTLFTAEGLIRALVRGSHRGIVHAPSVVHRAYIRWLMTQGEPWPPEVPGGPSMSGWLGEVRALHARRAPGNTCLAALASGRVGKLTEPINGSKGCGGVMRVAPVGLLGGSRDPFVLGAETAALTHGHPSGYAAAGFLAAAVAALLDGASLDAALDVASARVRELDGFEETLTAVDGARALARSDGAPSPERVESLGAGWVAEEALAIAVYCALVAPDLRSALLLAVNHSGDSDSTVAITGQLRGVRDGEGAIPFEWVAGLELRDVVEAVADDLADAFHGEGVGDEYEPVDERVARWLSRYPGS